MQIGKTEKSQANKHIVNDGRNTILMLKSLKYGVRLLTHQSTFMYADYGVATTATAAVATKNPLAAGALTRALSDSKPQYV